MIEQILRSGAVVLGFNGAPFALLVLTSAILPRYLCRTKSLEDLLPWLYLKGISSGDFCDALAALLGLDAPSLSASTITRLKEVWGAEVERWQRRDLTANRYVYFWVDGIYLGARMEEEK